MKQYTLITTVPRTRNNSTHMTQRTEEGKKSPFEELLGYNPESNNVDAALHKAILDENELSDIFVLTDQKEEND